MDRATSLEADRIDLSVEPPFELGSATVDPAAHEYRIGTTATRMQPQPIKVLVALHRKTGRVVTREELVDRCWDGRIVGEDVINRAIFLLRQFAKSAGGFEIETVPRAGYRLVTVERSARPRQRGWLYAGVGVAFVAAAIGIVSYRSLEREPAPAALAVAIVPFTAEHGNPMERRLAADTDESLARMLTESGFSVTNPSTGAAAIRPRGHRSDQQQRRRC